MTETSASSAHPAPDDVDEKWRAYPDTILEFEGDVPLRLDLRRRLSPDDRAALAARGLGEPFGVFTAENPAGQNAEDEPSPAAEAQRERTNERRARRLRSPPSWPSSLRR